MLIKILEHYFTDDTFILELLTTNPRPPMQILCNYVVISIPEDCPW